MADDNEPYTCAYCSARSWYPKDKYHRYHRYCHNCLLYDTPTDRRLHQA